MEKTSAAKKLVVRKIKDYLETHPENGLSLDEIAAKLNYSKFYMERAFAEVTGMSVGKYIRERRLTEAAEQLVRTKRPVIDIAYDAGYASPQAFTQAFRRRYLCSPLVYRKNGIMDVKQEKKAVSRNASFRYPSAKWIYFAERRAA